MKRAAKIVGVAAGVYLLLTVALYFCIRTPERIEKLMSAVPFPVLFYSLGLQQRKPRE